MVLPIGTWVKQAAATDQNQQIFQRLEFDAKSLKLLSVPICFCMVLCHNDAAKSHPKKVQIKSFLIRVNKFYFN